MKKTETYLKRFFLLFFLPTIWTFSIYGQCDRTQDSINLVKLHEALGGTNWTYEETKLEINSFDPPNLPNAGQPWDTNIPIDQWHGIALDSNGCVTMIALHNNNLTGELPDFLSEFKQLKALNLGYNHLTGTIPTSLISMEHLTKLQLNNNDLEGCIPDEPNVCAKGFSPSFENDGYNFSSNYKLPSYGSILQLCFSSIQIGEICDDGNPDSIDDIIQEDCSCRGIICKINDSLELIKLYNNTNGDEWSFDKSTYGLQDLPNAGNKWSPDLPIAKWHGIIAGGSGCVTGIYLNDNNLSSELPVLELPFLNQLVISSNNLSGNIVNFNKLPQLYLFDGSSNQFKGNIPSIENVNYNFTHFDCSDNQFTGRIPLMSGAERLEYFNCSNNQLTGSIPSFEGLFYLKYINCSNNNLNGSVLLDERFQFSHFYCQNNELNGSLPDFRGFSGLIDFDCSNNNFSGKLPQFSFYNLEKFNCSNNKFDDGLPTRLTSFKLKKFDCSNNEFKGSLPETRSGMPLKEFDCSNNLLTGELDGFNKILTLEKFDCSNNQLTGTIKDFENVPFLKSFNCSNNKIAGRLPSFDFTPNLEVFNCSSNLIGRSIPSLDSLSNLRVFDCSDNNLSETLPDFNNNANLEVFDCSNNLFIEGEVPDLKSLPNLIHFNCGNNQLTGELPSLLKNKNLKSFIFSNNKITGKLHYSIERLDSLERFYGFHNQLEGCIPLNFNKLCSLGNSTSTDSVGYNLSFNPMLAWFGDLQPFCDNEPQIDQPCDDGNPETHNDMIQGDCSCEGTVPSSTQQLEKLNFDIYPNPTTGVINLPAIEFKNISLFNYSGQKLLIEVTSTLDVSHLPTGVYYLKFQTDNNIFLKKVVKK